MTLKRGKNFKIFLFALSIIILFTSWINSTVFLRSKLADYYLKSGQSDKAVVIYEKIIRREQFLDKNRSVCLPLKNLCVKKNIFNAHYRLLGVYKSQNKWYEAALEFAKLISLSSDFSIDTSSIPETCALSLAFNYNENHEKAIGLLDRIKVLNNDDLAGCDTVFIGGIWKDMKDPFPHFARGRLFLLKKEYAEALWEYTFALLSCNRDILPYIERDLNLVLKETPCDRDTCYKLGLAYKRLGDQMKAIGAFENAVSIDSGHLPSYFQLRELYRMEDSLEKANEIDFKIKEQYSNMQTVKIMLGDQQEVTRPVVKIWEAEDFIYKNTVLRCEEENRIFNKNALKIDDPQASGGASVSDRNQTERSLLFLEAVRKLPAGIYRAYFRLKLTQNLDEGVPLGIMDVIYTKFYKTPYTGKRFFQAMKVIYASDFKEAGQYQDFYLDFFNPGGWDRLNFRLFSERAGEKICIDRVVLAYNPSPIDTFHIEVIKAYVDLYIMALK